MIHIKQMENGHLKTNKDGSVYFRGKTYSKAQVMFMPYHLRPWEVEAHKGSLLIRQYLEAKEADLLPRSYG